VFDEGMMLLASGGVYMLVGRSVELSEASRRSTMGEFRWRKIVIGMHGGLPKVTYDLRTIIDPTEYIEWPDLI
jgi:hypothetical protein